MKEIASRFREAKAFLFQGLAEMIVDDRTDFARIVVELRQEAAAAAHAAALNPGESEQLRRKVRNLERAAARIEADARARESYVVLNRAVE
jgi:hypothetical protein